MPEQQDEKKKEKTRLEQRLDAIGWGLFLIMIGGLWMVPEGFLPEGTWLIGTGIIIFGLTYVRYRKSLPVSGFWIVMGIIAVLFGIGEVFGIDLPVFPILLVIIGLSMVLKPFLQKKNK